METKSAMPKANTIPDTWLEGVDDDDEATRPGDSDQLAAPAQAFVGFLLYLPFSQ